ncbi:MAG: glycosyltransferase family 4 protein [Candidatus Sumerlaeota bacterium]|nr:glycosyltransferase family 4 protein [Candidatus Sumerlaeota bacterium]
MGGGAASASFHIARELVRLDCSITLLTSHFRGLRKNETIDGVNIVRIPVWRKNIDRCSIPEMLTFMLSGSYYGLRIMKREMPDVVLAFFTIPCSHIGLLGKWRRGIPYIVSLRGGDVPGTQPEQLAVFHAITKPIIKILLRNASAVVANSRGLGALAQQTLANLDIKIIPNGVDLERFSPCEENAGEPHRTVRLLFVGRASQEKNLTEAWGVLKDCLAQDWTFSVIGDGPQLPRWKKEVQDLGLGARIEFLGWKRKEDMPGLYREFDLFIFPSTSEGMPNVVLEAMASGLPIVATKIRGNEDLVEHEVSGFLYEPGDRNTLASSLMRLLKDADLRRKMGRNARRRAESFSWKRTAEAYLQLLRQAADQRSRH